MLDNINFYLIIFKYIKFEFILFKLFYFLIFYKKINVVNFNFLIYIDMNQCFFYDVDGWNFFCLLNID